MNRVTRREFLGAAGGATAAAALGVLAPAARAQPAGQGSLKGVTIRVLASANPDCVAFRDIVCKTFAEQTGATLQVDLFPYADNYNKAVLSFAGKQHDIYWVDQPWLRKFQKSDYLEPLDTFVHQYNIDLKMFFPNLVQIATIDKHLYALPAVAKPVNYGYRKDVLEAGGLKVPTTWADLLQVARKLNDPNNNRYGFLLRSDRGNPICWSWMPILRAFGGEIFDDKMKPIFNSPAGLASVEFLKELSNSSMPGPMTIDDVSNALANGVGMQTTVPVTIWPALDNPKNSKVVDKIDYADMPVGPSGKRSTMIGFAPYVVAKASPPAVKDAAFRLFKYFVSDEVQRKLMYGAAWYPAIPKLYQLPGLHRSMAAAGRALGYGAPPPLIPEAEEWFDITGTALQDVLFNGKPVKASIDQAATQTYDLLKSRGYYG